MSVVTSQKTVHRKRHHTQIFSYCYIEYILEHICLLCIYATYIVGYLICAFSEVCLHQPLIFVDADFSEKFSVILREKKIKMPSEFFNVHLGASHRRSFGAIHVHRGKRGHPVCGHFMTP